MKKKLVLLALALVMVVALSSAALADLSEPDFVDSWEVTGNMTEEELTAIVEEVLHCRQGTIPDHAFAAMVRMQDINPELANAAFDHMAEIAVPAEKPQRDESTPAAQKDEPERFGIYVRDGHGGHYEYLDEDDLDPEEDVEAEEESVLGEGDLISPQDASDCHTILYPKNVRETAMVGWVFSKKDRYAFGSSGFFLNDTVVATAAHVLYNKDWSSYFGEPSGWADEVYIIQAHAPETSEPRPYGVVYANNFDMTVGSDWKPNPKEGIEGYSDDADWGIFPVQGTRKGNFTPMPIKKIDPNTYMNKRIKTYGYPAGESMRRVDGITTTVPAISGTYRNLFSTDTKGGATDCEGGMSGGPVLDADGYVVGIFTGATEKLSPPRAMAVGMDKWLYQVLSKYQ